MFTKGEWIADSGDSELWGIFQKEDCQGIAYLCEPNGKLLRPEQAEANARLMAASPRMVKLLEYLVTNGWNAGVTEEAKDILAEVEGTNY